MAKTEAKPFESVKAFERVTKEFKRAEKRLKENEKYFKDRFGEKGGSINLGDGTLTYSAKVENGMHTTAYAKVCESMRKEIMTGKVHQMNRDAILKLFDKIMQEHTKPGMASQKVTGTINETEAIPEGNTESVDTMTRTI